VTLVASLHAVDLALRHFPRVVGVKDGASSSTCRRPGERSLLRELYAAEGGLPLAGAAARLARAGPAAGTLPPLRCA
jgi:phosphonate transport system ATP-binding protein